MTIRTKNGQKLLAFLIFSVITWHWQISIAMGDPHSQTLKRSDVFQGYWIVDSNGKRRPVRLDDSQLNTLSKLTPSEKQALVSLPDDEQIAKLSLDLANLKNLLRIQDEPSLITVVANLEKQRTDLHHDVSSATSVSPIACIQVNPTQADRIKTHAEKVAQITEQIENLKRRYHVKFPGCLDPNCPKTDCDVSSLVDLLELHRGALASNKYYRSKTLLPLPNDKVEEVGCNFQLIQDHDKENSRLILYPFRTLFSGGTTKSMAFGIDYDYPTIPSRLKAQLIIDPYDQAGVEALKREVALSKKIFAPGIAKPYHLTTSGQKSSNSPFVNQYILTQDLYETDLRDGIKEFKTPCQKYHLVKDLMTGLVGMHNKNIVHRDLKPENILIDASKQGVLADFGLSAPNQSVNDIAGTRQYMSPEAYSSSTKVTASSDVWGAALTFVWMMSETIKQDPTDTLDSRLSKNGVPPTFETLKARVTGAKTPEEIDALFGTSCNQHPADSSWDGLICRMLEPNPKNRLTANESLDKITELGKSPLLVECH